MKLFKARRSESQTVREAKRRRDKGNIPRQEELISAVRQGRSSSSRLANELRRASADSGRTVPLPPSIHCMTPLTPLFSTSMSLYNRRFPFLSQGNQTSLSQTEQSRESTCAILGRRPSCEGEFGLD